jgi:3-oxoacyl-[acyl-carrier protein] reductase
MDRPVALVTGASRGIGRAIAVRLAQDGYCVVINYRQNSDAANEVQGTIAAQGGVSLVKRFDVSKKHEVQKAIEEVASAVGPIQVLVNNAAVLKSKPITSAAEALQPLNRMADEDWEQVIATNLTGVYHCTKAVVTTIIKQRLTGGRIINIGSVGGEVGNAFATHYAASKAGLIGFTRGLARELAPRQATANIVSPGLIATDATAIVPESRYLHMIPLGRAGQPAEVAYVVSFLASERAAYITGQIFRVDGGMYM